MGADPSQKLIIDARDGFVLADAGPGTGKTHTVTARCLAVLRDHLGDAGHRMAMLTFTRNAAAEMEDRLASGALAMRSARADPGADPSETLDDDQYRAMSARIRKSYIGTFDSFCLDLVKKDPSSVSGFFGFGSHLTSSASVTENDTINRLFFRRFLDAWIEEHGSDEPYGEYPAIASRDPDSMFGLINRLMSMGVIPMKGGAWWAPDESGGQGGGSRIVLGDPEKVLENLKARSAGFGSSVRDRFRRCRDSLFSDGPFEAIEGSEGKPSIPPEYMESAAREDRGKLVLAVHDIYRGYLEHCVSRDHLTFQTVACFAYVALYESPALREDIAFDHLIVDEFQDTNTLQLMICLMSLRRPNLCVVGDWRQGIYGFRFVSTENILRFHSRLAALERFLNDDGNRRVPFRIPPESEIASLPLDRSYRSSQTVIHAAYSALWLPTSSGDGAAVPEDAMLEGEITSVQEEALSGRSSVVKVHCESKEAELDEVVRRILDFKESGTPVLDKETQAFRPARFRDISVLCRTTKGCRAVYGALRAHGVPVFLQGELEIMNTCEGKLLLAWLRFVENAGDSRGYVPILGYMGYSAAEIAAMDGRVPASLLRVRRDLSRRTRRMSSFASAVFEHHGMSGDIAQAITTTISSAHRESLMTISEMITLIETDIEARTRYDVDGCPDSDAVVVQTMHKSKGLEYPIVVIPFIDASVFPLSDRSEGTFLFSPVSGIRCTKRRVLLENGDAILGGSWRTVLVKMSEPKDREEEKRLFFVAISRAKQHVVLIGGRSGRSESSPFFKGIPADESPPGTGPVPVYRGGAAAEAIPRPDASYDRRSRPRSFSVHDIMGNGDTESAGPAVKGKGMQYGTRVHALAQMMVMGAEVDARTREDIPEHEAISRFLRDLPEGQRFAEVPCHYRTEVDGRAVTLAGSIDLLVVGRDEVHVFDWKTDPDTRFAEDYRIQLSVYLRCAERQYPGRSVDASIVWLCIDGGRVSKVDPLTDGELSRCIAEAQLSAIPDGSFNSRSEMGSHPGADSSQGGIR